MSWNTWWADIPSRAKLANANVTELNSQLEALKYNELAIENIVNDALVFQCFRVFFSSTQEPVDSAFWLELKRRANEPDHAIGAGFDIRGLSAEEMKLRVDRVRLNLALLRGIEALPYSQFFKFNEGEYPRYSKDHDLILALFTKFLRGLSDDEISELVAVADSDTISFMPAHKEILIEAYDRSVASASKYFD